MITLITRNVRLRTIVLVIIHGVMTVLRASQRADVPAGGAVGWLSPHVDELTAMNVPNAGVSTSLIARITLS